MRDTEAVTFLHQRSHKKSKNYGGENPISTKFNYAYKGAREVTSSLSRILVEDCELNSTNLDDR